jgi:hypothetical protein
LAVFFFFFHGTIIKQNLNIQNTRQQLKFEWFNTNVVWVGRLRLNSFIRIYIIHREILKSFGKLWKFIIQFPS